MKKPAKHLTNLLRFSRGANTPIRGPLEAEWEAINTCNARCKTCLDWQQPPDATVLSTTEARDMITQLARAGLINLTFSGGEPLLRKDLSDQIAYAKKEGLTAGLVSNGLLITERLAKKLVDSGLDVVYLSIDAANGKLNDSLRGLRGYFDLVMNAIDNIKSMRGNASPRIVITATVSSRNVQELVPLAELAISKGIEGFRFQLARVLEHQNFVLDRSLLIQAGNREAFIEQLDKLLTDYQEVLTGSIEYYKALRNVLENPAQENKDRPASEFSFVQIDSWGNVYTSPAKIHKLGNVRDQSFETIWYGRITNDCRTNGSSEAEASHLFDVSGTMSVGISELALRRFFKLMRPIFNGAKLF
ncbi:MAG: radical SAM/SPASM domain-containing protein [bacterium]